MKKVEMEMSDELREEYDLRSLRIRKVGSGRKKSAMINICLDPDVAEMFPNSESVNEALRFLIRIAQENKLSLRKIGDDV